MLVKPESRVRPKFISTSFWAFCYQSEARSQRFTASGHLLVMAFLHKPGQALRLGMSTFFCLVQSKSLLPPVRFSDILQGGFLFRRLSSRLFNQDHRVNF